MTHAGLSGSDWSSTVDCLGGAAVLEQEAPATGAFQRAREVKRGVDLLRLILACCLGERGLRLTAAWAEAIGLASMSNVALLGRLRNAVPWLEKILARLLGQAAAGTRDAIAGGRPIRLVDATTVRKAGPVARLQPDRRVARLRHRRRSQPRRPRRRRPAPRPPLVRAATKTPISGRQDSKLAPMGSDPGVALRHRGRRCAWSR
jgi:hypothetical protein